MAAPVARQLPPWLGSRACGVVRWSPLAVWAGRRPRQAAALSVADLFALVISRALHKPSHSHIAVNH